MYDMIIVGAGTAGLSAGIYAERAGKSALVLEGEAYGGQIINTPDIENYPGISHISGFDFATGLYNQATELGCEVKFENVVKVEIQGNMKKVITDSGEYEAPALILATGAKNRKLGVEREEELTGHGVSYCATCDGMFYKEKVTAVAGGGNTAVEDAEYLADICEKVYIIHRRDEFRADSSEVKRLHSHENVEFVLNSVVTELESADGKLNGIKVHDKVSGEDRNIAVDGFFVAVGQVPDNNRFSDIVDLDEKGYIIADDTLATKTPGVFAAGDCRTKKVRQLVTAASDGAAAALAACDYIKTLD